VLGIHILIFSVDELEMNVPGAFAKRFQCPCCNNPWNQTDDGAIGTIFCDPCLADDKGYQGIDPKNFDHKESPKDNFYLWSNGGWRAANPIPAEYSSWNTFIALRDLNLERLKVILDELGEGGAGKEVGGVKLADYYKNFMDEEAIESRGLSVVSGLRDLCKQAEHNLAKTVATLHSVYGVDVFFGTGSSPDKGNSQHSLGNLRQGGLGLPDRDYYFEESKAEKVDKYLLYVTKVFQLLGEDPAFPEYADVGICAGLAAAILALEKSIASTHLTRTASRDPNLTYNKMSVIDLITLTGGNTESPDFDWRVYFEAMGKGEEQLGEINVSSVEAIRKASSFMRGPVLQHYLLFHCVNSFSMHLPRALVEAHFVFFQQELMGTVQQLPRWKRALQGLEAALGDELGQLYVAKHFREDAKQRALVVVESVREALEERLLEVQWMSEATRVEAMAKMRKFKVKIGFPDRWVDYSNLAIQRDLHFENVVAARGFAFRLEVSRMNAPTDLLRWYMTPQTVNAYYHPSLNEIVFPAAILQPPFFDASADAAVQFGSLGSVVGHEMRCISGVDCIKYKCHIVR
jgi:putative endopeptidase